MKKYKVTLYLMVDPTKGDETFKKSYTVEAESEYDAYTKAGKKQSEDVESIARRSVFDYKVKEV